MLNKTSHLRSTLIAFNPTIHPTNKCLNPSSTIFPSTTRSNSTTSSHPPPSSDSIAATSSSISSPTATSSFSSAPLSWNTYLQLRRKRRHYNLAASVLTSLNTTALGVTVLSQQNLEAMNMFGLDPFITLGSLTALSGAAGWLLGPFVGNAVFGIVHRNVKGMIAQKDRDFYARIKRYRVDPSGQSVSNPVPDYYGEKIGSVSDFRGWMKDQRAYNKKRKNFL